jgi:hypothetical protein
VSAKVFVSCGQRPGAEKEFCAKLDQWLRGEGFNPYFAIQSTSILDLNSGIIRELQSSDYYLFINFAREKVVSGTDSWLRGSVYTNQELAIAVAAGFEKCLFVNQKGIKREGIHEYLVSNVPEFDSTLDLLPILKRAIKEDAKWSPAYSRQLEAERCVWGPVVLYGDQTGRRCIKVLYVHVQNRRPDLAALHTVARLVRWGELGHARLESPDMNPLKASGFPGYSHTIFPEGFVSFDLCALSAEKPGVVYLNSALDVTPRAPLIERPGNYELDFEVFSQGFPKLSFTVALTVPQDLNQNPTPNFSLIPK